MPESPAPVADAPKPTPKPAAQPPRDSLREFAETIAFVVTLVLMLKLFVVEAFVIPTGSMAETLYGYQKFPKCPECGFWFPVNASNEVDPSDGHPVPVVGACCPNCRHTFTWDRPGDKAKDPGWASGDRVLVLKALYHLQDPTPGDVVVFKFPVDPQVKHTAQNYIKRLWGRGGETIAINRGDLYRTTALKYDGPGFPRPADPTHLWQGPEVAFHSKTGLRPEGPDFTYHNAEPAVELFDTSREKGFPGDGGGFELIRKPDDLVLAMARVVYDNEHQSEALAKAGVPPRWGADPTGWTPNDPKTPKTFAHAGPGLDWVRYRHLAPRGRDDWDRFVAGFGADGLPLSPVTNFLGYNAGIEAGRMPRQTSAENYWVGDLILETEAEFGAADAEAVLELSKGPHRYQAVFAGGQVKLIRTGPNGKEMASAATGVTGGRHALRFANVDCRLRVWVDGKPVPFGDAADYPPDTLPEKYDPADRMEEGWTAANDVAAPASVGAKGPVTFGKLRLSRDTYFTYGDSPFTGVARYADTYFVHPGHYLCLGDNSAQSSDSRKWGTVPARLLLGKAVAVFFPFPRIGLIE